MKRLYRSPRNRVIAGVCGGIGEYLNLDPVMIRVIAIFLLFLGGGGILAYLIAIVIIPPEPEPGPGEGKAEIRMEESADGSKKTSSTVSLAAETAIKKHVSLLGWIYIVLNALNLCVAVVVFALVAGGGFLSGDENAIMITMIVASAVAGLLILISIPGIVCGFGLIKFHPWARTLALVLGIVNLINIPFGTVLGAYTLWVLMQEESGTLFEKRN